jgi:hypothetical protein
MNVYHRLVLGLGLVVLAGLALYTCDFDSKKKLRKEVAGLNQVAKAQTVITKSETGETVASQPKAEVSKETFSNLMDEKLEQYSRQTQQDLGKVYSLVDVTLSTIKSQKLPVKDSVIITYRDSVVIRDSVRAIRWNGRFENGLVLIKGDSATVNTQTVNKLAVLESKDRWKAKHILPWNWGKRKKRVKLLVFNPDSRVDTLTNLSIIQ